LHRDAAGNVIMTPLEQTDIDTIVSDTSINLAIALVAIAAGISSMAPRGEGTILLTGGGIAIEPMAELLTLSAGKAGLRMAVQGLFAPSKAKGIHVATLTVSGDVRPNSAEADEVANAFWALHAQPRGDWTWEASYP
jgi:short-subunit dehydrogenase